MLLSYDFKRPEVTYPLDYTLALKKSSHYLSPYKLGYDEFNIFSTIESFVQKRVCAKCFISISTFSTKLDTVSTLEKINFTI